MRFISKSGAKKPVAGVNFEVDVLRQSIGLKIRQGCISFPLSGGAALDYFSGSGNEIDDQQKKRQWLHP